VEVIERAAFDTLLDALRRSGFSPVGPTLRDGRIAYGELGSTADLPEGWTDEQSAGRYRLRRRKDRALFGYVVGPDSWKKFLYPPSLRLWRATRVPGGFDVDGEPAAVPSYAFIGVRPCELRAIEIQDRVLTGGDHVDPDYRRRRATAFVVVVNCGQAGGNCFCVSMGSGPRATAGFDLALTEILDEARHLFTVEVGSERGTRLLSELPHRPASDDERAAAARAVDRASANMGRTLDTSRLGEILRSNQEHPRWTEVGRRCLTCASCTLACPTCFCGTVEDSTDLSGETAERVRRWDSCFTIGFSYIHGGSLRVDPGARYRQWMTHKLAWWTDQFGTSGCVGCGRCITWCPVGIDITEEARAIRRDGTSPGETVEEEPRANP